MVMAPSMMTISDPALNLVKNPLNRPRLPKNSPMMTRKAMIQGNPNFYVKNPIVPSNPNPPYQPSSFCAP